MSVGKPVDKVYADGLRRKVESMALSMMSFMPKTQRHWTLLQSYKAKS